MRQLENQLGETLELVKRCKEEREKLGRRPGTLM